MIVRLLIAKWRACLMAPVTFLWSITMPFIFHLFLPGFKGAAFPALLIFYLIFGQSIMLEAQGSTEIFRMHTPVTMRQMITGNYLFIASLIGFAWAISSLFVHLSSPNAFIEGIIPKALGLAFLISGLITFLNDRIPKKGYQLMGMVAFILLVVLTISSDERTFLPWLSLESVLLIGLGGFTLAFILSLIFPPRCE